MDPRTWWYADDNAKAGPVTEEELRTLIQSRAISRDALVWSEGMAEWKRARDVRELIEPSLGSTTPPPLPRQQSIQNTAADPYTPPRTNPAARGAEPPIDLAFLNEPLAGPWRRFFARQIDLLVVGFPIAAIVSAAIATQSVAYAFWVQKPGNDVIYGLAIIPVVLLAEALLFAMIGTTPGKALLGVKVRTLSGEKPGLAAYVGRMVGVYFQGFGMGIPIVILFTMGSQFNRLSRGESASYDQGVFRVTSSPLGFLRVTAAGLAIIGSFVLQAVLTEAGRAPSIASYATSTWTNPETSRQTTLPAGWTAATEQSPDGLPVYMFRNPTIGAEVVFGSEAVPASFTLDDYLEAWRKAVAADMALTEDTSAARADMFDAIGARGHLVADTSIPITATLVQHEGKIWRVVMVGGDQSNGSDHHLMSLRDALLYSLPEPRGM